MYFWRRKEQCRGKANAIHATGLKPASPCVGVLSWFDVEEHHSLHPLGDQRQNIELFEEVERW